MTSLGQVVSSHSKRWGWSSLCTQACIDCAQVLVLVGEQQVLAGRRVVGLEDGGCFHWYDSFGRRAGEVRSREPANPRAKLARSIE